MAGPGASKTKPLASGNQSTPMPGAGSAGAGQNNSTSPTDPKTLAVLPKPQKGLLTWEEEGQEGGKFHSRQVHWPEGASGVTIGRGFDMKNRSPSLVSAQLVAAGVPAETAAKLAEGSGKMGPGAKAFCKDEDNRKLELTGEQQLRLFEQEYSRMSKDTKWRVKEYIGADFDKLDPKIKEILVDLRYRCDLGSGGAAKIKDLVVANDLEGLAAHLSNAKNWNKVPDKRFKARREFLNQAVADKKAAESKVGNSPGVPTLP